MLHLAEAALCVGGGGGGCMHVCVHVCVCVCVCVHVCAVHACNRFQTITVEANDLKAIRSFRSWNDRIVTGAWIST